MNRPAVAIISLAVAMPAATAPSALAKELVAVRVCGKTQCHESRDKRAIASLTDGGPPTDPPSRASGWYRSTLVMGEGEDARFTVTIVPAQGLIRSDGEKGTAPTWLPMTPASRSEYGKLVVGLEPRPPSTLAGVATPAPVTPPAPGHAAGADAPVWPWILAGGFVLAAAALAARRWNTA